MKEQALHEGLYDFLADTFGLHKVYQNTNPPRIDFEFRYQNDIPGFDIRVALNEYYSKAPGVHRLDLDEASISGSLLDAISVTHAIAITLFRGTMKVTIREI